jgi:MGT family glycosyltransferase
VRVLFTTLRNTSHFLPLVPFVEACRNRGHEVAVAAPPDLESRVAATGAEFMPFGHPGDEGLRPLWARLRQVSEDEANRIVIGEIFAGACAQAALPGLLETVQRWRPAIVVRESQEYAAVVATEKLGIPRVRVAIIARSTEAKHLPAAAPALDALARGAGLPADPSADRVKREAALTLFPASLDSLEERAPVFRFKTPRKQAAELPEWWGARPEPLVYLTLGTVTGGFDEMRSSYRVALDAVAGLPIRVLLTVGNDLPLEMLGNVPANVHVERFVAQDDVLPHAAAVICHGGSGTVLGTLAAGVPMVVVPLFADQPQNAERIAAIGAGLMMTLPGGRAMTGGTPASPDELRRALLRVLKEASFRVAAQRVAAEMAGLPAIDAAPIELERLASAAPRLPESAAQNQ